jgi:hypothetical protein
MGLLKNQVSVGAGNFCLDCSGAHPASYSVYTGAPSTGVKRPGRETDCCPPPTAKVNSEWSYTSTLPYVFMARCVVKYGMRLRSVLLT